MTTMSFYLIYEKECFFCGVGNFYQYGTASGMAVWDDSFGIAI